MDTIPDSALPGRSTEATTMWPTLAVAVLATAGAIVVSLATPAGSNAAPSVGPSAAAPALRDASFDRRCRA